MENNRVKIGARILSQAALDELLPANRNIGGQIDEIRKAALEFNEREKKDEKWDKEYDRHFNNIFSILGIRGSGKTSVLLTMKYKLTKNQYENDNDIILPLVVPEKMEKTCDILGFLVGLFGDVIEDIENNANDYRQNKVFENCKKKDTSPLKEKYNELLRHYCYTNPQYREILINQYEGFSDYVNQARNILDSEQKLLIKFEEFIEELIGAKRMINKGKLPKNNTEFKREPLIMLFFDDVDLSTERCAEVLNIILRYLSHPNLVVFIAGNYNTFSEILTINALKRDGLLNRQMAIHFLGNAFSNSENALQVRQTLTQDLLKKAMPPAFRYDLPIMDENAKADFIYSTEKKDDYNEEFKAKNSSTVNTDNYMTLMQLIEEVFIKNDESEESENINFLKYNGNTIYAYFKIFDDTRRGTMNVYKLLYDMLEDKKHKKEYDIYLKLNRFLDTVIQSSSILSKYTSDIRKIVMLRESISDSFVDYSYLDELINTSNNEEDEYEDTENVNVNADNNELLTLCIFIYFAENIISLEEKRVNPKSNWRIHGIDVLVKFLNRNCNGFKIYPQINDISPVLYLYTLFSKYFINEHIAKIKDFQEKNFFLERYFRRLGLVEGNTKPEYYKYFEKIYDYDRDWVQEKINLINILGKDTKEIINDTFTKTNELIKKTVSSETVTDDISRLLLEEMKVILAKPDIKNYLENSIANYYFNEKKSILFGFDAEQCSELQNSLDRLILNINKLNYLENELQTYKSRHIERVFDGIEKYDLKQIYDLQQKVTNRIDVLKEHTENDRKKSIWKNVQEKGIVEYISFENSKSEPKNVFDILGKFDYNSQISKYNCLEGNLCFEFLGLKGYLVRKKYITNMLKNVAIQYFNILEELILLENYINPEIKAIIDMFDSYMEDLEFEQETTTLSKSTIKLNTEIEKAKIEIINLEIYKQVKDEIGEISERYNLDDFISIYCRFLSEMRKRESYYILLNNNMEDNSIKRFSQLVKYYELEINKTKLIFERHGKCFVKKAQIFDSLYYLTNSTNDDDVEDSIDEILDGDKEDVDVQTLNSIIEGIRSEIKTVVRLRERKIQSRFVLKYDIEKVEEHINKLIKAAKIQSIKESVEDYRIGIAANTLKDIIPKYFWIKAYVQIIKNEDDFYKQFKNIKEDIFTDLYKKDLSGFNEYIKGMERANKNFI